MVLEDKSQTIINVCRIHRLGTIDIYTKPCSRCWDIWQEKWKLWPARGARTKVRGSPKSLECILWGPGNPSDSRSDILLWTTNVNLMAALEEKSEDHQSEQEQLLRYFRLDQSDGPTDRPTDRETLRSLGHAVSMATNSNNIVDA